MVALAEACRQRRQIYIQRISHYSENKVLFYNINRQYNQLGGSLIPLGNGLIWGLSVSLCCLQVP